MLRCREFRYACLRCPQERPSPGLYICAQNWRGIYKPYSGPARHLQEVQELIGELVEPSEVFMLVKVRAFFACRSSGSSSSTRCVGAAAQAGRL